MGKSVVANLFLIGASKCASTYLHDLLGLHPDIYMSKNKEPCFFNEIVSEGGLCKYEDSFKGQCGEKYIGESTPLYSETTYFKGTPQRIHDYNPDSKIIYIVREPFSRLESVYKQTIYSGHDKELKYYDRLMPSDFNEAIINYPPFLEATKYRTHLDNYLEYFTKNSVKVILFEELVSNPQRVLVDIFKFLGINLIEINCELAKKNESNNKRQYNRTFNRLRGMLPVSFREALPEGAVDYAKSVLPLILNRKIPKPDINDESVIVIRDTLRSEVEGIYEYMEIKGDPWSFFNK